MTDSGAKMPTFDYKAKKDNGEVVSDTLVAESERAALEALEKMNFFPIEIIQKDSKKRVRGKRLFKGIKSNDIAVFSQQLADLVNAGLPLDQALNSLSKQKINLQLSEIINEIKGDISAGKTLADSLGEYPHVFSPLYVNMVKAGETGGFLVEVLNRISMFCEKEQELKTKILTAMIYPIILSIVGTGTVVYLLIGFVPKFTPVFQQLGESLPLITKIMLSISYFLKDYIYIILGAVIIFLLLFQRIINTEGGRLFFDRFKLRIPVFKNIVIKSSISRFTRTLGTLLESGVSILEAINIAKDSTNNQYYSKQIERAADDVREGKTLAEPLAKIETFPAIVVDMISTGEKSGNLSKVLVDIADSFDTQVDKSVKILVSVLDPLMILTMATIVGFIVISMLLPIFTLINAIK